MSNYEIWPTIRLSSNNTLLKPQTMPELVHMDDPATDVMIDFKLAKAYTIDPDEPIDHALSEMKISGAHLMLVVEGEKLIGLIGSEDILGEKPIRIMHQRRIPREKISVRMVMLPVNEIIVFDIELLKHAKVGHIVQTLIAKHQHYALVVRNVGDDAQWIRGLFSSSLISRKLHMDIAQALSKS